MVMNKGPLMQSVQIAKTRSQPIRPNVAAFTGNVEYKKYPKAVWNSMTKEQHMQIRKLQEQQGIKPAAKQKGADARIAALEAKLRISSQPEEGDIKKTKGETPKEPAWRRNRGNPMMTCQASGAKCKEPSWFLGHQKGTSM